MREVALRRLILTTALALTGASPVFAGWGPEPVQVHATTNACPQVAACEDAANGAFVAWEESDGPLRVAHLLPSGDLDPAWPPFVVASTMGGGRRTLRAQSDGAGGALLTWYVAESLFVQRVTSNGSVPAPWPERGRAIRRMLTGNHRATVVPDGAGGLYVSWIQFRRVHIGLYNDDVFTFLLDRRGADGGVYPGWPTDGKVIGLDSVVFESVASTSIAPAPGGGLWAAFATVAWWDPTDPEAGARPGAVRVLRLNADGDPMPGWSAPGVPLAGYPGEALPISGGSGWWLCPSEGQVAVSSDGADGAYVVHGIRVDGAGEVEPYLGLHRIDESGSIPAGYPAGGLDVSADWGWYDGSDHGPDASVSVQAGPHGEAFAGHSRYYFSSGPLLYRVVEVQLDLTHSREFVGPASGRETAASGDDGLLLASLSPDAALPYSYLQAQIDCQRSNGPGYNEAHWAPPTTWYGDVGVAGLRDGGAILCWSETSDRNGVYAVRLNSAGLVTDVPGPAPATARRLALRFAPGEGVRVRLALAGTGETHLLLADVTGRAVARETFALEAGARERTIAGTARLAPGLYFARVTHGAGTLTARVVVTR